MKRLLLITLYLITIFPAIGQDLTAEFEIILPEHKVHNSLYNKIKFIDSRDDVTNFGSLLMVVRKPFGIQTNLRQGNKYPATVIITVPLATQFGNVLTALIDSTAQNATLYFQLRELAFAESTAFAGNRGYFYFKAGMYARSQGGYQKIKIIDSVVSIKSTDLMEDLVQASSKVIANFISANLTASPTDSTNYTASEIANIDNIEKSKLPLYNTTRYRDGLYATFSSFSNQTPDAQISVEMKKDRIVSVTRENLNGKKENIWSKDVYAIVNKGIPYIAIQNNYFKINKDGSDFYFILEGKLYISPVDIFSSGSFFGLMIRIRQGRTYMMKIDHSSGGFKQVKEIDEIAQ